MKILIDRLLALDQLTEEQLAHFEKTQMYQALNITFVPLSEEDLIKSMKHPLVCQIVYKDLSHSYCKEDFSILKDWNLPQASIDHSIVFYYQNLMMKPLTMIYDEWVKKIDPSLNEKPNS